jgi:hypothetical protein
VQRHAGNAVPGRGRISNLERRTAHRRAHDTNVTANLTVSAVVLNYSGCFYVDFRNSGTEDGTEDYVQHADEGVNGSREGGGGGTIIIYAGNSAHPSHHHADADRGPRGTATLDAKLAPPQ